MKTPRRLGSARRFLFVSGGSRFGSHALAANVTSSSPVKETAATANDDAPCGVPCAPCGAPYGVPCGAPCGAPCDVPCGAPYGHASGASGASGANDASDATGGANNNRGANDATGASSNDDASDARHTNGANNASGASDANDDDRPLSRCYRQWLRARRLAEAARSELLAQLARRPPPPTRRSQSRKQFEACFALLERELSLLAKQRIRKRHQKTNSTMR